MLDSSQRRLPDVLEAMLESAGAAWAKEEDEAATTFLQQTLEMA